MLCGAMQDLKWKRSDIVLGTKVFWGGKGASSIVANVLENIVINCCLVSSCPLARCRTQ